MKRSYLVALTLAAVLIGCQTGPQAARYPTASMPGLSAPATINANIYKPEGPGPFPAVLVLHGCGGVSNQHRSWAETLKSWGYVAVIIDSFGSRGYGNLCRTTDPTVYPNDRISDIIGAAEYLNTLPYVKPKNIGLIGFSHGGWTIMKAVQESIYLKEYGVRGAVAYYPYCNRQDGDIALPLLVLIGADDTWTPADRCRMLQTDKLIKRPELVEMVFYPNTYHGFDDAAPVQQIMGRGLGGAIVPQMIGRNPAAAADSEKRTKAFFETVLK